MPLCFPLGIADFPHWRRESQLFPVLTAFSLSSPPQRHTFARPVPWVSGVRRAQTLHIREPLRWLLRCSHPAAVCPEGGGGPACLGARFRVRALLPGGQDVCVQRAVPGTLVVLVGRNQRRHCSQASGAQVWWAMRGHQDLPSCRVGWGRPTQGERVCVAHLFISYSLRAYCVPALASRHCG